MAQPQTEPASKISIGHLRQMTSLTDYQATKFVENVELDATDLATLITTFNGWTPSTFFGGTRSNHNFQATNLMVLDVDNGLSLADAVELFKGHKHIISTTKSHQKSKNGIICDRYRVVLFLSEPITTPETYKATWLSLAAKYQFVDIACKDPARFYSRSVEIISQATSGQLIEPVFPTTTPTNTHKVVAFKPQNKISLKRSLARTTTDFLANGAATGEWNPALNKAAFDMKRKGYTEQEALEIFKQMDNSYFTGSLDERDLATIASAFRAEVEIEARWPVMGRNSKGDIVVEGHDPRNMRYLITDILQLSPALNLLKNKIYVDGRPWTDSDTTNVRQLARQLKIQSYDSFVLDSLQDVAAENQYHPFKAAVESKPWDGHDHITALFNTLTFTDDSPLYFQYLRKWLIGVIAKVYQPGSQNLVLTLKGAQGAGKSRWLAKMNIADSVFGEGAVSPGDKDHQLRHANYVIWHCSELSGTTSKRTACELKEYFLAEHISVREAYGRFERTAKSCLSFCASVNDDTFLTDQTGNRRYLVLPIATINHNHTVDMQQVFAQAKALYDQGEQYWFDGEDVAKINEENEVYIHQDRIDLISELISEGTSKLTIAEIFHRIANDLKYTHSHVCKLGAILKKKGITSVRERKDGVPKTLYLVKLAEFEL